MRSRLTHTSRMQVNKRGEVIHAEVWDTVHPKQFLVSTALAGRLLSWRLLVHAGHCGSCVLCTCITRRAKCPKHLCSAPASTVRHSVCISLCRVLSKPELGLWQYQTVSRAVLVPARMNVSTPHDLKSSG